VTLASQGRAAPPFAPETTPMTQPLMPKATAVWLVENTALSFDQIAAFTGLHPLEVKGIADGEVAVGIRGLDPVLTGQLDAEEIKRCEADPNARLALAGGGPKVQAKPRRGRYTPVSKRHERPNAIAWLLRNYPILSDTQIARLLGTTPATIAQVRGRTHWNAANISPQDPVLLGLCSEAELLEQINLARRREARVAERAEKGEAPRAKQPKAPKPPRAKPSGEAVAAVEAAPQPDAEPVLEPGPVAQAEPEPTSGPEPTPATAVEPGASAEPATSEPEKTVRPPGSEERNDQGEAPPG
jgi:hypothetical protein